MAVEPGIVDPYYNSIDHSERHSKAEIRVLGAISLWYESITLLEENHRKSKFKRFQIERFNPATRERFILHPHAGKIYI